MPSNDSTTAHGSPSVFELEWQTPTPNISSCHTTYFGEHYNRGLFPLLSHKAVPIETLGAVSCPGPGWEKLAVWNVEREASLRRSSRSVAKWLVNTAFREHGLSRIWFAFVGAACEGVTRCHSSCAINSPSGVQHSLPAREQQFGLLATKQWPPQAANQPPEMAHIVQSPPTFRWTRGFGGAPNGALVFVSWVGRPSLPPA